MHTECGLGLRAGEKRGRERDRERGQKGEREKREERKNKETKSQGNDQKALRAGACRTIYLCILSYSSPSFWAFPRRTVCASDNTKKAWGDCFLRGWKSTLGLLNGAEFFPPHHQLHPLGSASYGFCKLLQIPEVRAGLGAPEVDLNDSTSKTSCILGRD